MKNSTHKVVILENLTSPYVHQAIIVLKDCDSSDEIKAVRDAERIVKDYFDRNRLDDDIKIYTPRRKRRKGGFLKAVMFMCVALMIAACVLVIRGA